MFKTLKKSSIGKRLYRFSRRQGVGRAVHKIARLMQVEVLQLDHYKPSNIAHNRRQAQVLERFLKGLDR
jgi:hypothetical protein